MARTPSSVKLLRDTPLLGIGGHEKTDQPAVPRLGGHDARLIVHRADGAQHLAAGRLVNAFHSVENARNRACRYSDLPGDLAQCGLCNHCKEFAQLSLCGADRVNDYLVTIGFLTPWRDR